jgi:hypothetical protein
MKLAALCLGIGLGVLPMGVLPAVATAAAPGVEDCYYYHGHRYPYRYNGHYYRYRWNGGYYNYRYGGQYWRYNWHGGYYNYYWHNRYYRDRYRCEVQGWCYR